jgi:hypothetical protein
VLEVDSHDDPTDRGVADLVKPGVLENLARPDVYLTPGDLLARLGDHRKGLECAGAALTGEVNRGSGSSQDASFAGTMVSCSAAMGASMAIIMAAACPVGPDA